MQPKTETKKAAVTVTPTGCFPEEVTAFPSPRRATRDLPLGDWNMIANGWLFTLTIHSIAPSGKVDATFTSGEIHDAEYDRSTFRLTFTRYVEDKLKQRYVGYLFMQDDADDQHRLAGTFEHPGFGNAGWYATQRR